MNFRWLRGIAVPIFGAALASVAVHASADDAAELTYARDIAPILNSKCAGCHHVGDIGPMSLMSYDEARPWLKSIRKSVVEEKTMPPWHATQNFGVFSNDRRLTEEEIAKIDTWIRQGGKPGDLDKAPAPPTFKEGWRLGEPDYIMEFPETSIPAGGTDQFRNYPVKVDLPEDKWVSAIEILPSNRKIVHHVIAFLQDREIVQPGAGGLQGWLGAWAAGGDPQAFPEGTGRLIKKGSTVVANMHYHPNGEAGTDKTRIGLHFAKGKLEKEVTNLWIMDQKFKIPAGEGNHPVTASFTFNQDSHILTLTPHMHFRGKDMTMWAVYPDGRKETLISVPKWDFNWQTVYEPAKRIAMPKGSKIEVLAHFDNSTSNPSNPDPNKVVAWGPQSTDEMMIGFVDYIVDEGVRPEIPKPPQAGGE